MTTRSLVSYARVPLAAALWLVLGGSAADPTRFAVPPPGPKFVPPASGVLFADNFAHGDMSDWAPDREGVWGVWRGMLRADLPDEKQVRSLAYFGNSSWTDVALDLDICAMRGVDKGAVVRVQGDVGFGVDLRGGGYQDVVAYVRQWPVGRAKAVNAGGAWNHLRIEARGMRFRVFVNGVLVLDKTEETHARPRGRMALPAYTGGAGLCTVYYDNVVVTSLN